MILKSLLLRVAFFPCDYKSKKIDVENINLAVIHIPDQIGDAMSIFPAIRSLEARQIKHLIIVSSTMNRPVFDALSLDQTTLTVISMPFQDDASLSDIKTVARNIRLTYGEPDLCIEAMRNKNLKTMVFISTLRARTNFQIVGLPLKCFSPACKIPSRMDQTFRAPVPMSWAIMMREAGFPIVRAAFEFPLGEEVLAEVRRETGPRGDYIAVNFEGSAAERTFTLSTASQLIAQIRERLPVPLYIVHSPKGADTAAELCRLYENVHRLSLSPSINRSAAVIKDALMVITPDTSILHIASACNVPAIAVYTNYKTRWATMQDVSETIVVGNNINQINLLEFDTALSNIVGRLRKDGVSVYSTE